MAVDTRNSWQALFTLLAVVALCALVTSQWARWLPMAKTWRPLVPIGIVVSLGIARWVWRQIVNRRNKVATELHTTPRAQHARRSASGSTRADSNPFVNLVNSVATALSSTMTSYWMCVRFHAGEDLISVVIAAAYLMAGCVSVFNIRMSRRLGAVRTLVYVQLAGTLFVLAMPLVPWFWLAALLNLFAVGLSLGSRGSRSTISAGGPKRSRSWQRKATTVIVLFLTTGVWPAAFGQMMEDGEYVLPFFMAGSAQFASAIWFRESHTRRKTANVPDRT
jgi:hypothetical protein